MTISLYRLALLATSLCFSGAFKPATRFGVYRGTSSHIISEERPRCFDKLLSFTPDGLDAQNTQTQFQKIRRATSTTLFVGGGFEDLVFTAQNTASSLADTVFSSSKSDSLKVGSLAILYGAGLLTSFSPCSLGLLPLTVSYISTAAGEREDKTTLLPTLAFAAGLAVVFTGLGLSASLLGGLFGGKMSAEGNLGGLILAAIGSLVSVAMGLQLLDLINVPLPSLDYRLRAKPQLSGKANKSLFDENGGLVLTVNGEEEQDSSDKMDEQEGSEAGALFRTFLLGGTSALVASPCATPVLASLLAFVASSPNPYIGASFMLTYTFGYSTPLLLIGATGGQALVNLQANGGVGALGRWVTPLTGGVLIFFGTNGFLVALLGDPSLAGLAPILE